MVTVKPWGAESNGKIKDLEKIFNIVSDTL